MVYVLIIEHMSADQVKEFEGSLAGVDDTEARRARRAAAMAAGGEVQ